MAIEEQVEQPARPFAWGQLAVGSVIGAIAVWSMALHYTGATPSEMLAGVAESYRGWRDGLLTPLLSGAGIELSTLYRDMLIFDLIVIGAMVRTTLRYPAMLLALVLIVAWPVVDALIFHPDMIQESPGVWTLSLFVQTWIRSAAVLGVLLVLVVPLAGTLGKIMEPTKDLDDMTAPANWYAVWNVVVIAANGVSLLALDWSLR